MLKTILKISFLFTFFILVTTCLYAVGDAPQAVYESADDLIESGRLDEAESLLLERLASQGDDYIAMTLLGNLYKEKGDRKRALHYLTGAVNINPLYPEAHLYLGKLYVLMRRDNDAVEQFHAFKTGVQFSGDMSEEMKDMYIDALHYFAEVYFSLKRYDDSKKELDEILYVDPQNQYAYYNLGIYYYRCKHNRPKAYESFKRAVELNKGTGISKKAEYAIEFIRNNPDSRVAPDFSFIDKE